MTPGEATGLHRHLMATPGWRSEWSFLPIKLLTHVRRKWPGPVALAGQADLRAHQHRRWAKKLGAMIDRSAKPEPEPFVRHCLARDIRCYGTEGDRSRKTLVVCFPGTSARMMMPTPVFLQHLDARQTDVVMLRDPSRNGYRGGLDSLARGFAAAMDELAIRIRPADYRRAVTIGISGGGLAGLLAALRWQFDAALIVGSSGPDDPRWSCATGSSVPELIESYRHDGGKSPHVQPVHGFDHVHDRRNAEALAAWLPATLTEIGDASGRVGHNALLPLLMRGDLASLLEPVVHGRGAARNGPVP